jgi:hypothetical protein
VADVRVLFWRSDNWIGRIIQWRTKSPWTHVAVYIKWPDDRGCTYEFDALGARSTAGLKHCDEIRVPIRPVEIWEAFEIDRYFRGCIRWHNIYAYATILALLVIYPTRWFWERIGWRPFSAKFWGRVCSSSVAEAFKRAGIDLVPKRAELYESPGEIQDSWFLKREGT